VPFLPTLPFVRLLPVQFLPMSFLPDTEKRRRGEEEGEERGEIATVEDEEVCVVTQYIYGLSTTVGGGDIGASL